MKRLMIVYNPRSSQFERVRDEVLNKVRELKGWMVGKYEVRDTDVDDNARRLAKVLNDGDLVVAAGGDGTATIAVNGIMLSGAEGVKFGVLGYGNFNDMARTFRTRSLAEIMDGKCRKVWPLEAVVDGEHYRYGVCYFTLGMFAEATELFDDGVHRKKLKTGRKSIIFSWKILARWYFKNKKRTFIPNFRLNGREMPKDVTDYVAVNGKSMARVMRGGRWCFGERVFLSETGRLGRFWRLVALMGRSVLARVPGKESEGDVLEFARPADVEIQAEGEYKKLEGVRKIEVRKSKKCLGVMTR